MQGGTPYCCSRALPDWQIKQLFSCTESPILPFIYALRSRQNGILSILSDYHSALHVWLLNVCSSLLLLQNCCHAYFILFPGLCTVTASCKDGSFFTMISMSVFPVLTHVGSIFLHRIVRVFCFFVSCYIFHLPLESQNLEKEDLLRFSPSQISLPVVLLTFCHIQMLLLDCTSELSSIKIKDV